MEEHRTFVDAAAAAGVMTACLGRTYRFEDESVAEAYASRATDDVRRLTGRDPLSLEQLLHRRTD